MPYAIRYSFVFLIIFSLSACQAPVEQEDVFNVPFKIIAKGDYSQLPLAKELIIRDQNEWHHLWLAHTGDPRQQPPKIDFNAEMVMAFFLGQRPTAGYEIKVQRIRAMDSYLLVELLVRRPAPHSSASMALTQTHTIIKLPSYTLPVKFRYRQIQ